MKLKLTLKNLMTITMNEIFLFFACYGQKPEFAIRLFVICYLAQEVRKEKCRTKRVMEAMSGK